MATRGQQLGLCCRSGVTVERQFMADERPLAGSLHLDTLWRTEVQGLYHRNGVLLTAFHGCEFLARVNIV